MASIDWRIVASALVAGACKRETVATDPVVPTPDSSPVTAVSSAKDPEPIDAAADAAPRDADSLDARAGERKTVPGVLATARLSCGAIDMACGAKVDKAVCGAPAQRPLDEQIAPAVKVESTLSTDLRGAGKVRAILTSRVRSCYARAIAENPDLQGQIKVALRVDPSGQVIEATPSTSLSSGSLVACITTVCKGVYFDADPGRKEPVSVPVDFHVSKAKP